MARYELIERIGVGGMAEIFRGRAVAGGGFEKPVAIKRILPHLSQDKRFVELLITEAKTLSQLRHRNVVQIYDVGLGDDGQYFLVMEYVDGVDCGALADDFGRAGLRMPIEVALHVAGEVCEALEHAHRARGEGGRPLGLVHRDVTPSNILLSRSGEVKLTDFGIAKRMEEATGHGGVRGKFAYISPEQAINAHVDARSDVYSLGVVFYELALGKRLYSHLPDFEALRAVREAQPPRVAGTPGIDPELADILDTALAPRPEDRFPSAGSFGATLRSYRYSLASGTTDPATEIARLVDAQRRGRIALEASSAPMQAEPTVVRIVTAAGFQPGRTVSDEHGDGHTTRLAVDALFDDEQTHSVSADERAALSDVFVDDRTEGSTTGEHMMGEATKVISQPSALAALPDDRAGPSNSTMDVTIDASLDPADEGTRLRPPPRRAATVPPPPPGLLGAAASGASRRAPAEPAMSAMSAMPSAHAMPSARMPASATLEPPTQYGRLATPTARDVFHPQALLLDGPSGLPPVHSLPREGGVMSEARRRALLVAGTACIACAVAAFVVVGVVIGDRPTPVPAVALAPDAAPAGVFVPTPRPTPATQAAPVAPVAVTPDAAPPPPDAAPPPASDAGPDEPPDATTAKPTPAVAPSTASKPSASKPGAGKPSRASKTKGKKPDPRKKSKKKRRR